MNNEATAPMVKRPNRHGNVDADTQARMNRYEEMNRAEADAERRARFVALGLLPA